MVALSYQNRSSLNQSVRPILAENFAKIGPRITFAAKISLTGPILAAKTGPPCKM